MFIVGHTLLWHNQTPAWVFQGTDGKPTDRATLLARLEGHIKTVVGRYKGRIHGWDVVNEALNEDGTMRDTAWRRIIGDDYIAKAFEFAQAADPGAELYYNDFNLAKPAKRAAAIRIARDLKAKGLRVDGIGEQGHWLIDSPSIDALEATITDIAAAGFRVHITELDIDPLPREAGMEGADLARTTAYRERTNMYRDGLPDDVQSRLAARYADVFRLFLKHKDKIARVTFWGVSDAQTWLNNFPVRGRTNHPLLWDRKGAAKPAYDAVADALRSGR
jgi:endo-1,4-beta-xylanase